VRPVLTALIALATLAQPARIFVFEQPFWVNLHHFLYVLGRNELRAPDRTRRAVADAPKEQDAGLATLSPAEQATWRAAVTAYGNGWSRKDAVFDSDLVALTHALVRAGDARRTLPALAGPPGLPGLDAATATILNSVAPIYRATWWPAHTRANADRITALETLIAQYGARVLAYITHAYQQPWPADGYPVNVSAYTNWAGAYSTDDRLLVVSSRDAGTTGLAGLETIFHESMHQWDGQVAATLTAAAERQHKTVPDLLSHAMIFYTAGAAVQSVAPDYTPYADANGIWQRGPGPFKAPLDAAWKPYLDGRGTLDAAIDAVIRLLPAAPLQ